MLRNGSLLLSSAAVAPYLLMAVIGDQAKPTYAADVLPVMKAHCASCHSGASASAGLDLTTIAGINRVIKSGASKESLLVQRLRGIGGAQMPMGFAPLPGETIDKIAGWIDAGAVIDAAGSSHWAYVKPVKSPVPRFGSSWVRNPIDAFILARLQKEGLKPSPMASKEKLLRRVYLDLIGLPPTPQEIDSFVVDRRPDAYERVVDSLLANPHYGERQAEPWLDLSRYADSDGYEKDLNRTAWKYRDWLIDAFNRNLPYDRFTIEQLAGDLLPNATTEQLVATGFNRNTMLNREGGVDQQDAHFNVVLDRVNTTATVWLGSTLQCARCHDHKYDPFTQRDFYKMMAFYANSVVLPEGPKSVGEEKWFESQIEVPSPTQDALRRKLKTEIVELDRRTKTWSPSLHASYEQWLVGARQGLASTALLPEQLSSKNGATLAADGSGVITSSGKLPDVDDYTITSRAGVNRVTGIRIEAIADDSLQAHGPGRAGNGNFVISGVRFMVGASNLAFSKAAADFDQRDYEAPKALGKDPNFGWAVLGATGKSHELVLELAKPIEIRPDSLALVVIEQHWPGGKHVLGKFRVSLTTSDHPALLVLSPEIRGLIAAGNAQAKLKEHYLAVTPLLDRDRVKLAESRRDLEKVESQIPTALIMRDKPAKGPLTAFIHHRGEFLSPTELVTAGYPAALTATRASDVQGPGPRSTIAPGSHASLRPRTSSALPGGLGRDAPDTHGRDAHATPADPAPRPNIADNDRPGLTGPALNRLDLARWMVSRDNPLTARVEVNRLWEQFFGRGIVETSEDFGTQGSRPSHPELLDWLACEFMDKGWDMKAMVRLMVTSATYRQTGDASPESMAKDPQNVLLSRGPRFRLDAETIRDTTLAAAGLLSPKIGGPSVFPYQPAGVWDTPYNGEQWMQSKGEDRYRRGLYTFVKRSSTYPNFLSFDSTSRETCTVRRIRTNTPLQALALLNDQAVFDAAKALALRMAKEGGQNDAQKLSYGFRLCTGRRPTGAEGDRLGRLLSNLEKRYEQDPKDAEKVAGSPQQAAWAMVGNVLLNLDETVTKG